jgi:hypothetical protein
MEVVILRLVFALAFASLVVMAVIDRALGSRAEFLNAWTVMERLVGRTPTSGPSVVASRLGPTGEFVVVILANLIVGFVLASVSRYALEILRSPS